MNHKIALVTGAGSGIGRASSLGLLEAGYFVILTGRRIAPLEETKELSKYQTMAACYPSDMTDRDSVKALFEMIEKTYGRLDLL
ncbi:MAG: SDR family NAD(P)-dependent oxidoreductase, partial [Saprospiraceae bacterium]|nr:SDR family NAD(P)-dependent oxidoreductase [Saprospiraceae bacterium]